MNKKTFIWLSITLIILGFLSNNISFSQELNLINNVIDKIYQPDIISKKSISFYTDINSYDIYNNPVMLLFSDKKNNLKLGYINEHKKFDFRRPFEEEKQKKNIGFIDITYLIDTTQGIHSFIKFNDSYSKQRHNIFNLYPYRGNPYLLGDVNSGDFDLQMLTFEADYSKILSDLLIGGQLSYNVGNSVKRIFPKPTANYLEIGSRLSLGYKINEQLIASIFGDYFRTYEELRYEVTYTSPQIFKFRGLDYPFLLLGTSSLSRRNEDNGFGFGAQIKYSINDNMNIFINGKFQHNKEEVTDGITSNPKLQGKWQQNNGEGNILGIYSLNDYEIRIGGIIEIDRQFASKPDLNESILKRRNYCYSAFAGLRSQIFSQLSLSLLYQIFDFNYEVNDYINYVRYKIPSIQHSICIGANYDLNEYFNFSLDYKLLLYSPSTDELYIRQPAQYFYTYFLPEIEYYQTKYNVNNINLNFTYHYGILGDISLKSNIYNLNSDGKGVRNIYNFNLFINLFVF